MSTTACVSIITSGQLEITVFLCDQCNSLQYSTGMQGWTITDFLFLMGIKFCDFTTETAGVP